MSFASGTCTVRTSVFHRSYRSNDKGELLKHRLSVANQFASRIGRFDAVQLLLKAGANPDDVKLTPLIEAVASESLADERFPGWQVK